MKTRKREQVEDLARLAAAHARGSTLGQKGNMDLSFLREVPQFFMPCMHFICCVTNSCVSSDAFSDWQIFTLWRSLFASTPAPC